MCYRHYIMARSGMNANIVRYESLFMNIKPNIYSHLSSESDLEFAKSLKPKQQFSRTKFSFTCSKCGNLAVKNLGTIRVPFLCHKCALSEAHTTPEYYNNYASSMTKKYGANYMEVFHAKATDAIIQKYGSYSNMYKQATPCREHTMLERYGVLSPASIDGHGEKCANTKQARYGSATYNNRSKAAETLISQYGSIEQYYQHVSQQSNETKIKRYGTHTYNNREKARTTSIAKYGVPIPIQNKMIGDKAHYKYTYQGIKFDSSYDLSYYIWLTDHKYRFEYRPNIQFDYYYDGNLHKYNPDFRVDGELVELKGRHFFKDKDPSKEMVNPYNHNMDGLYEAKHQCMIRNQVKIIVDCSEYETYVANTYGKDYIASFRNHKPKKDDNICIMSR